MARYRRIVTQVRQSPRGKVYRRPNTEKLTLEQKKWRKWFKKQFGMTPEQFLDS